MANGSIFVWTVFLYYAGRKVLKFICDIAITCQTTYFDTIHVIKLILRLIDATALTPQIIGPTIMEGHLEVILIQNIAMPVKLTKEEGRNFVKSDVIGMVLVQSL